VIGFLLFIFAPFVYLAAHEGGHFLFARFFGLQPKITMQGWHVVTRFITPISLTEYRLVMSAGFGTGLFAGCLALCVGIGTHSFAVQMLAFGIFIAATVHFWMYPHTALPEANDFNGMCGHLSKEE
jgi:hypothetical protein